MRFRWLILVAAVLLATPPAEAATPPGSTPIGTATTKGCKGAPVWKIGYRFFFSSASGSATPRGQALDLAKRAAARYAREVGTFSRCGVRAKVYMYDEGARQFTGCPGDCGYLSLFPSDTARWRKKAGVDAVFYRYPVQSQSDPAGVTAPVLSGRRVYWAARFPVYNEDTITPEGTPWRNLLLHEWLHMVVGFYRKAHWLPGIDSVHAGCSIEPYKSGDYNAFDGPCIAQGRYFRDLMRGKVLYQGRRYGITKKVWKRCGTPRKPSRKNRKRCF